MELTPSLIMEVQKLTGNGDVQHLAPCTVDLLQTGG
jgi:hypothetical protein